MKVRFSPRAQRRVKLVATWWRKNRPSVPTLFDDELDAVIEMLKNQPMLGAEYQVRGGEMVRRTLLTKSAQHVYYSVDEAYGVIVIYSVWGLAEDAARSCSHWTSGVVVLASTGEIIELGSAYPAALAIKQLEDQLQLVGTSRT